MTAHGDEHHGPGDGRPQKRPGVSDVRPVRPPRTLAHRWLTRPRRPLGVRDLLPTGGGLFLPVLVALALLAGGVLQLLGPGVRFRPAGVFALLGAAVITAGIVLHLRRPPTRRG